MPVGVEVARWLGRPDPAKYADGVCGDRELKLAGYEVFRFGATELPAPLDRRVTRLARARRPAAASGRPVAKNLPRAQGPATSCPSTAAPMSAATYPKDLSASVRTGTPVT